MASLLRSGQFLRALSRITNSGQSSSSQQGSQKDGGNNGSFNITFPTLDGSSNNSGSQMPLHTWSLQNLQSALPVLSSVPEQIKFEENSVSNGDNCNNLEQLQRRGSDPLLEFYVDKQKLEDVSRQLKSSTSSSSTFENRVGLNLVKDLKEVDLKNEKTKSDLKNVEDNVKTTITSPKKSVEEKQVQTSPTITPSNSNVNLENEIKDHPSTTIAPTIQIVDEDQQQQNLEMAEEYYENKKVIHPQDEQPAPLFQDPNQIQLQVPLVPICEDPISHEWYPLPVVCQMFREQGRIYDLEGLLWGSQGIRPDDRKCIYFWTLRAYADVGMFPQAVDLTRRLETEGLAVDFPEYHALMNDFAMAVYQNTQFLPPSTSENTNNNASLASHADMTTSSTASTNLQTEQSLPPTPASMGEEQMEIQAHHHRKLKKALANRDVKASLEHYKGLEKVGGKDLNITESSGLIELLVKDDLIEEAVDVTERMLSREAYPMPRIFRFLLNRLASRGEVEAMTRLGSYLTSRIRKEVSFDNRLCNAYLAAGRAKDYLDIMIRELDELIDEKSVTNTVNEEKLQTLKEKFPRGGAMGLLEANPHLVEPYTQLALKFVELGYVAPVNVLWTYHFISGRHDLAEPLWNKYVRSCPQIMFQKVCQTARATANVDLAERLVVLLENAVVTNGARGIAYSCLLDVLTQNRDYARGVKSLEIGLNSGIKLEDMNRTALRRLKDGFEDLGIGEFPYDIPKKINNNGAFDQDQDDDVITSSSSSRCLSPISMSN